MSGILIKATLKSICVFKVTDDFRQAAVAKAEADGELEPEMPETPGVCYVRLLPQTPDAVIPGKKLTITITFQLYTEPRVKIKLCRL